MWKDFDLHTVQEPILQRMTGIVDTQNNKRSTGRQLHAHQRWKLFVPSRTSLLMLQKEARHNAVALAASHATMSTDETAADAQKVTATEASGHDVVSHGPNVSHHVEVGQLVFVTTPHRTWLAT